MASELPRSDNRSDKEKELQTAYLILLGVGAVGAILAVGAVVTSWWWWEPLVAWLRDGTKDKLWQPLGAIAALLAGLGVMFAAFQSARRFERTDATLRRVLYGYNAFLTCFLLLLLLLVVNVFVQIRYPLPFDTTEGGFYSLSEKTKQYVAALDRPVEVYMLLNQDSPAAANMKTVLTQMQSSNPRYFHFEEIPIDGSGSSRIRDLARRFKQFAPRPGLLVAFGDKPEANHTYINATELTNTEMSEGSRQRQFNGEVRLMQELYFLAEDKRRPVVYFTQGHGEPDMTDRGQDGLADLVQRLTQANYDVRPLRSTNPAPEKNTVPADADVVVIAGPKQAMNDIIPGLRRYMNPGEEGARKGKLVVLFGPTGPDRQRGSQMVQTGLEAYLREFSVNVTNEQILMLQGPGGELTVRAGRPYPESVMVAALQSATESHHPLAMLAKGADQDWVDVRRLEALPGGPSGSRFQVEPLLVTHCFAWLESDMSKSSLETWQRLRRDPKELEERLKQEPLTVLAAVTEGAPDADPHSPGRSKQGSVPRLLVFGCSSLATNEFQNPRAGGIEFDLVRGSIDWCRERYSNIGVEPKSYQYFSLPKQTSYWNLFYLPVATMMLAVFGLGLVVWNIRRR